jgi:hypothetical protein
MENVEEMLNNMRKHRKEMDKKNHDLFVELQAALQVAELKHPVFAYSFKEGVFRIMEELGEVAAAYNKSEGKARVSSELLDTLCVVWRMCRGDWDEKAVD